MSYNDSIKVDVRGISVRLPKCSSINDLWSHLQNGHSFISEVDCHSPDNNPLIATEIAHPDFVNKRGVLENTQLFDASFFNISRREVELMDPQIRLMLEVGWQALEDAGISSQKDGKTAVFASKGGNSYMRALVTSGSLTPDALEVAIHGNDSDFVASLLAYKMDLRGPAMTVQTACSSSLVGVHLACQSLVKGECDQALVVASGVPYPQSGYRYIEGGIRSKTGTCRPFDNRADGVVEGSGVVAVVLTRTGEYEETEPTPYARILGSAINNDGHNKVGYAAPSVEGQEEVIEEALNIAGINANSVQYLETHGTGTLLGDAIEWTAADGAYRRCGAGTHQIAIGAVKANLGHLDAGAGLLGLIKTCLVLKNRQIPPLANYELLNQMFDADSAALYVPTKTVDLSASTPLRAAVSSFGVGGTNAHAILERAEPKSLPQIDVPTYVMLSARDPDALQRQKVQLADYLKKMPNISLNAVASTLAKRPALPFRAAFWSESIHDLISQLEIEKYVSVKAVPKDIVFSFPGQGTQYPGMGVGWALCFNDFKSEFERVLENWAPELASTVERAVFDADFPAERMRETDIAQPALFSVEISAAACLMARGVKPVATIGHSLGEISALTIAGVLSLADATRFIATRGAAMHACPEGAMLALSEPETNVDAMIVAFERPLWIAAVNGLENTVVAGARKDIKEFAERYKKSSSMLLQSARAFHSPMIAQCLPKLRNVLDTCHLNIPGCAVYLGYGNATAEVNTVMPSQYLIEQAIHPVRFTDALGRLNRDLPNAHLVEIGPGSTLSGLASALNIGASPMARKREVGNSKQIHNAMIDIWSKGGPCTLLRNSSKQIVGARLPVYPFKGENYEFGPLRVAPVSNIENATDTIMDVEGILKNVWQSYLGVTDLSPESDLYQVGGDSFVIIRMAAKIRDLLGVDVSAKELMAMPKFSEQHAMLNSKVKAPLLVE